MNADVTNKRPSVGGEYKLPTITAEILAAEDRLSDQKKQLEKEKTEYERAIARMAEIEGYIAEIEGIRDAWVNQLRYYTGDLRRPPLDSGDDVK